MDNHAQPHARDITIHPVGAHCMRPVNPRLDDESYDNSVEPRHVQRAPTIGDIIRGYKSAVTKRVRQLPGMQNIKLWQRNYWEHIIRDERAHFMIREYIQNNPTKWETDCFHCSTNENELHEPSAEYHTYISNHTESNTVNDWFEMR